MKTYEYLCETCLYKYQHGSQFCLHYWQQPTNCNEFKRESLHLHLLRNPIFPKEGNERKLWNEKKHDKAVTQ